MAATWVSTVRTDNTSCAAISALLSPSASSRTTSTCRGVSPAGLPRVACAGPRGMRATPSSRSRSRTRRASGSAPSESSAANAASRSVGSELWASAAACSYGQPARCHRSAASRHFPAASSAYGSSDSSIGTRVPVARIQYPSSAAHDQLAVDGPFGVALRLVPLGSGEMDHAAGDVHVPEEAEELRLVGELHGVLEDPLRVVELEHVQVMPDQVDVRAAGVLHFVRLQGDRQALFQESLSFRVAGLPQGDTDVVQRM